MRDFVIQWNNTFRYDYWYREKYNIAFNSAEHRALSPIDVRFAYEEEMLMASEREKYQMIQKELKKYEKTGQWLKTRKRTQEQEEELFELIDFRGYKPSYGKED